MSHPIVRRLAAAIGLVAVLGFAVPAGAASPNRSSSPRTPMVLGPSLVDQFLSWLGSLWLGHEPNSQTPQGKALGTNTSGSGDNANSVPDDSDRGAQIDPNG
ncbi:MAG TPA: hypothetical protein VGG03_17785 [Thermoanaerobaculia bacterium]